MEVSERIVDIARYYGENELICKKCGLVMDVSEAELDIKPSKRKYPIFRALCPDCGAYIKRMRNSYVDRIFWKNGMHPITDFDSGLLMWMLKTGYIKDKHTRKATEHHLRARIVTNKTIEPMSVIEQREITLKKEIRGLRVQLEKVVKDKQLVNHEIVVNSAIWDSLKMAGAANRMKALTKKAKELTRDIEEKTQTLEG